MTQFGPSGMAVVFLISGLAWFGLGLTVALESRRASVLPLASSLKYLAAFGLLLGVVDFLDLLLILRENTAGQDFGLRAARAVLLAGSTVALIYFGAHLLGRHHPRLRWLKALPFALFFVWLLAIFAPHLAWVPRAQQTLDVGVCLQCHRGATPSYLYLSSAWLTGADTWARYLLYLPGSLLAGWAMLSQRRWFLKMGFRVEAWDSTLAAAAFAFNALVAGLIVPPAATFPASALNYATFFQALHFPPQVLRALAALLLTVFLVRILNIFETERRRQLERATEERLAAQEETRRHLEEWTQNLEEKVRQRTAEVEERNRQVAILEERERLAREMHDSLGQILGYLSLRLLALERHLASGQTAPAQAALTDMERAVQNASADVREAILGLKTRVPPAGSLLPTLRDYLTRFGEQADLQTAMTVAEGSDLALSPTAQVQLLRIVQEALTNIRKHARARRAFIAVEGWDGDTRLVVGDDGAGFDLEEALRNRGQRFGLQTMQERAEEMGARFAVETALGRGTRVIITLPKEAHRGNDNRASGG